MAYAQSALWPIGYGNGNTVWFYRTADTRDTINTAGYFNDAAKQIALHDVIIAVTDTGGTPQVYLFHVNANNGTTVDVNDGLAGGTTDTD